MGQLMRFWFGTYACVKIFRIIPVFRILKSQNTDLAKDNCFRLIKDS